MPWSKPGRTISYTSERNGYINKLFRIDGAQILPNCCVLIDVTECDPEDYDWSSSEFRPPIDGVTGAVRPLPTPIYNFAAEPSSIDDDDGEPRRAAILLKWRNIEGIDLVEYELELSKDLSLVDNGYFRNVALGQSKIAPYTLLPDTSYRVRAKYGSYESGAPFEWSEWIQVKTADIRLGLKDIYPIDVNELNKEIIANQEWVGGSMRYILNELERIGAWSADQELGNFTERQVMRNEITLGFENVTAAYTHLVEVSVGPGSAIVTRIENLEVTIEEDIAQAVDLLQTQITEIDGEVTAQADAITALTTTVNNVSADATFRMGTVASPSGWTSRIAMQVRVGTEDLFKSAGLYLDATTNNSRVVIDTEQFVVRSGGDYARPLMFQGGVLYADEMRVAWAKIINVQVTSAQIADAAITSAKIGDLQVKTSNLDFNQVTQLYLGTGGGIPSRRGWKGTYDFCTMTINNPQGNTLMIEVFSVKGFTFQGAGGSSISITVGLFNQTTNTMIRSDTRTFQGGGSASGPVGFDGMVFDHSAVAGNNTYSIRVTANPATADDVVSSGSTDQSLKALVWKR